MSRFTIHLRLLLEVCKISLTSKPLQPHIQYSIMLIFIKNSWQIRGIYFLHNKQVYKWWKKLLYSSKDIINL